MWRNDIGEDVPLWIVHLKTMQEAQSKKEKAAYACF